LKLSQQKFASYAPEVVQIHWWQILDIN